MATDIKALLQELHLKTVEDLLRKVKSGEADAATLNCARQFLKDNGIDSTVTGNPKMLNLKDQLPEFDDDLVRHE